MKNRIVSWIQACWIVIGVWIVLTGCSTSVNIKDTAETATQQLLLTNAMEGALSGVDLSALAGRRVAIDDSQSKLDRGWLSFRVRQQLLRTGAIIADDPEEADWVVHLGTGVYGTDSQETQFSTGQTQYFPELTLLRRTSQFGVVVLALYATDRQSGQLVWDGGTFRADSNLRQRYLGTIGPFRTGTIDQPGAGTQPFP